MPSSFWRQIGWRGLLYETARSTARRLGELDPFVRMTARRSRVALATTKETAASLERLGPDHVLCVGNVALGRPDLTEIPFRDPPSVPPVRFISAGRLLHWKGFHLGLRAFARAGTAGSEYWIVGDGPERERLERRARQLGVRDRVRFWGELSRTRTLECLADSHVLVHPSLHDSGGWICAEAMASGRPVVCLDLGGPARVVTEDTGRVVSVGRPPDTVKRLARALTELRDEDELREELGRSARRRVTDRLTWSSKVDRIERAYELALRQRRSRSL